jgi:hypothetical protein
VHYNVAPIPLSCSGRVQFPTGAHEVINMHPRYHYWIYRVAGSERQLISRRGTILENPLAEAVLERLATKLPHTHFGDRRITVAEDLDTGIFALAIQHPRDTYAKKIGRLIATGRMVKLVET